MAVVTQTQSPRAGEPAGPAAARKWVYLFAEGSEAMRPLLGGKGAGVAEMTRAGMPVPPGFTITTEACLAYFELGNQFPEGLNAQVSAALAQVEAATGKTFGDAANPLLVSVRSGARASMPGMMDTVLNLGLNAATLQGLAKRSGDERFAWDAYRRFVQGFGSIVLGVARERFEAAIARHKERLHKQLDTELIAAEWSAVVVDCKQLIRRATGAAFPDDPRDQLDAAIRAVFESWYGKRAVDYRNFHKLPHDWGTAVNVQTMVFGNMGERSGTGVAFTRDPNTGANVLYGEYLLNAQGEDVVAGVRTPLPISTLKQRMPAMYAQFDAYAKKLEHYYKEMQDLEFTIEDGRLYMLQTRAGKRSPAAAVQIAVDMVHEGIIDQATAVRRVEPSQVDALLHPRVDPRAKVAPIAKGLNASPGAAVGKAVFTADEAADLGQRGQKVILVRPETSPDDFHGMAASQAILTSRGGATSHAAIVARQLGIPAVVGCEALRIDLDAGVFSVNGATVQDGDTITVDGTSGNVMAGAVPLIPFRGELPPALRELLSWADAIRRLGVWANADYPAEAALARKFGAQGVGLCRTEHMWREADRLPIMQEMIVADDEAGRRAALAKLLPIQRTDFYGILKAMRDLPVIIRLLDPPLHEFLPKREDLLDEKAKLEQSGRGKRRLAEVNRVLRRIDELHEANPMLGLRGCRLGIVYPEVYEMQVRAIIEAAIQLKRR
ncbi:MAG: pyruvate, phosphate dikinase, partial [Actinobacteria bacterium]|nr:pyruvate, phosphate dikinase [Actinomycetota bacterium]